VPEWALVTVAASCIACGSSGGASPASTIDVPGPRTLTVSVIVNNRLNNAIDADVTVQVTIGATKFPPFAGSADGWSYTMPNASSATAYTVVAVDRPSDYSVSACAGTLASNARCEVALTDTLVAPSCDGNMMRFLYRPSRFEGFSLAAMPTPPCETTWGTVRGTEYEHDADSETWLQLTKKESLRVLSASHDNFNVNLHGYLMGEWVCRGNLDDMGKTQGVGAECDEYRKYVAKGAFTELPLPAIGESGVFVGFKVYDCGHACWTELHPLVWWHKLVHPIAADQF